MTITRVFLGWDKPCLPEAARWLRERYRNKRKPDLRRMLLVTPTGRAARRIGEILRQDTDEPLLPKIITFGELPEFLYHPPRSIADALRSLLARASSLRDADADVLRRAVSRQPAADDLTGWLGLAQELQQLHEALAAEAIRVADVPGRCETIPDFADHERWETLAELQARYEATLAEQGLSDRQAARLAAIRDGECRTTLDVVLIATADLNRTARLMLERVGDRVTHLIHAPQSEAGGFDELGCLIVEKWEGRHVPIDPSIIRVVDRPRDQAYEIVRNIGGPGEAGSFEGRYRPDQVAIGLGDAAAAPLVQRTLELAGLAAQTELGRSTRGSGPALMLAALGRYLAKRRLNDFAALLRHPDVEDYLLQNAAGDENTAENSENCSPIAAWLDLLDRYATEHIQGKLTETWLGDPAVASRLKAVHDRVTALLPVAADESRPLPAWSEPLAHVLRTIYAHRSFDPADGDDLRVIHALAALGDTLRRQAGLDAGGALTPKLTAPDAIALTLARVADAPPPLDPDPAAIPLLGWLDLQLDDAPALIIAGFNEGAIPETAGSDPFLSDHVRRVLGMMCDRRRLARDKMMLTAMSHSKERLVLIAGRRGGDDDPLIPSRLLVSCPPAELPDRVELFFSRDRVADDPILLMDAGTQSRFVLPFPEPRDKPIDRLHVTAFRDYLDCPYRFYLIHVLKLSAIDDRATEMDELCFGTLTHSVLQNFGRSELAGSTDPRAIRAFLWDQLEKLTAERFGEQRLAAVVIQCEQLRQRLGAFARWQAEQAAAGWRILHNRVETEHNALLPIRGAQFRVRGKIDRIDEHPELGYRLMDYKTGDTARDPDQAHRKGSKDARQWIDLQLPLYRVLARAGGLSGPMSLGYIHLPKDLTRVGLSVAEWTEEELAGAEDTARDTAQKIYDGVFWEPKSAARLHAELAALCLDECLERKDLIKRGKP